MTTDVERLRALEVQAEHMQKEIQELKRIAQEVARFAAAQEYRNKLVDDREHDRHDDRWQVWLRWLINPGIPVGAIIILMLTLLSEGTP
jgi:hypothetical protein